MHSTPSLAPTRHEFTSQGLALNYTDWGNPTAPPLLLLHGGRDHCRSWDWVAKELREDWHLITPDLRGHGDSAHSPDGYYTMESFVFDLAELIHQLNLAPLRIIGHSLGGNIALRYSGLYPHNVKKIVAIEGLGRSPKNQIDYENTPVHQRMIEWIDTQRSMRKRQAKHYSKFEDALVRMRSAHPNLSLEQANHLTEHGLMKTTEGYGWKFDQHLRGEHPTDLQQSEKEALWARISCPTLLIYGRESWASNPAKDGRIDRFSNARVSLYENAGHWVHLDQHHAFVEEIKQFLP